MVNEDAIKENQQKITKIWPHNVIHGDLKGRMGITMSKGNYLKIILDFMCAESYLQNIGLFQLDLVVS